MEVERAVNRDPRRPTLLPCIGFALGLALPGWSPATARDEPEPPQNGSEIRVIDPEEADDFVLLCSGLEAYRNELTSIGLRVADLQRALPCVPGDFDGNGHFDFAVWGPRVPDDASLPGMRQFKVLYFHQGRILKSQQIETPGCDHLWLFEPKSETADGGAPLNPHDGLLQLGEGKTVYFYVYDDGLGILKRIEWPEPAGAGAVPESQ